MQRAGHVLHEYVQQFLCPNFQFVYELKMKFPEETAHNNYNWDILSGQKC